MENNRRYKGDEGLVPRDFRSGRERRRERVGEVCDNSEEDS